MLAFARPLSYLVAMKNIAFTALVLLTACGGATNTETQHGGEDEHQGHGEHGGAEHHGHHDHSDPDSLEPLMRELYASMQTLRGALSSENMSVATEQAAAIASACDDQSDEAPDPELFGPRFLEIDQLLHGGAANLAEATQASDLPGARRLYAETLAACAACHEQAPSAGTVDLTALAPDW